MTYAVINSYTGRVSYFATREQASKACFRAHLKFGSNVARIEMVSK